MPIEIRELVIRAVVADEALQAPSAPHEGGDLALEDTTPGIDMDALVQACVRQVMRVLARERER